MNGYLELMSRSFGLDSFDFEEPVLFSVIVDHNIACLNVHWIRNEVGTDQYSFHLKEVSSYPLNKIDTIRELVRAIKNILDEGVEGRLHNLHAALDEYRRKVVTSAPPERQKRGKRAPRKQGRGGLAAGGREATIQEVDEEEPQQYATIPTTNVRTRRMTAAGW